MQAYVQSYCNISSLLYKTQRTFSWRNFYRKPAIQLYAIRSDKLTRSRLLRYSGLIISSCAQANSRQRRHVGEASRIREDLNFFLMECIGCTRLSGLYTHLHAVIISVARSTFYRRDPCIPLHESYIDLVLILELVPTPTVIIFLWFLELMIYFSTAWYVVFRNCKEVMWR